jgi:hypothetical protein
MQARDAAKIPQVVGPNRIAQFQGAGSDKEIRQRQNDPHVCTHQMKTPTQHDYAAGRNASGRTRRTLVLSLWVVLLGCVVIGSLLPAASPVMADIGRLHINDKVMHFGAYLTLSLLPVIGFRDRRRGLMAGLSMFLLGILMEAGQHFSPGRVVELGDVIANGAGVSCGVLLAFPIRTLFALI